MRALLAKSIGDSLLNPGDQDIASMRRIRDMSRELGDDELSDFLTRVMRWLRLGGEDRVEKGRMAAIVSDWMSGPRPELP